MTMIPDTSAREAFRRLDYLVVEDMPAIRRVLTKMLRGLGVKGRIDSAGDGVEAWEMMQGCNYDIVICDVCMPRMTGLELKKLMRDSPRFRETPFLMVTGEVSAELPPLAVEGKFDGYLFKPFHSAMLEKWLIKLVELLKGAGLLAPKNR